MALDIVLPSLSAGMEGAIIAKWRVSPGDRVVKGQVLAEVETDKATMELEAAANGVIARLEVAAGTHADIGQVIATLTAEEDKPETQRTSASGTMPAPRSRRHHAAPLARRMAAAAGVSLTGLVGSGPEGRVVRVDVARILAEQPCRSTVAEIAPPRARAAIPGSDTSSETAPPTDGRPDIVHRLADAKQGVPHFYLSLDCELDALLALRAGLNEGRDVADRISINDFMIKAAAHALRDLPETNVAWTDAAALLLKNVDIAVAVAARTGTRTPVLRGADRKSLGAVSSEMKRLIDRVRAGELHPDEEQAGSLSVSNLGMYGVKAFSAIVEPPRTGVLAIGAVERRPIERADATVLAQVMTVTLSVDHRTVDGALAATLLGTFKRYVENPLILLV